MLRSFRVSSFFFRQIFLIGLFCCAVSCSQSSPAVIVSPAKGSISGADAGTLYPMIQSVYPGTLQSLDYPYAVQYGVSPESPGICIVFTLPMAKVDVELVDDASPSVLLPVSLGTAYPSTWFTVIPGYFDGIDAGKLKPGTRYTLRIRKSSYAYSTVPITSASRTGGIATIITSTGHDLSTGQLVSISGFVSDPNFNVPFVQVTVIDTTTFTYANAFGGAVSSDAATVESFNRTLIFSNLVEAPATTISPADPDYVEYKFVTGE